MLSVADPTPLKYSSSNTSAKLVGSTSPFYGLSCPTTSEKFFNGFYAINTHSSGIPRAGVNLSAVRLQKPKKVFFPFLGIFSRPPRDCKRHWLNLPTVPESELERIEQYLSAEPFQPFVIEMSTAKSYRIDRRDQCGFTRLGSVQLSGVDDGKWAILSTDHIIRVQKT
jgi:hypothetical protein